MTTHDLTTKEGLQAAVDEAGSWVELGQRNGIAPSTLKYRGRRLGVKSPFEKGAKTGEAKTDKTDPVLRAENTDLRRQVKALTEGETSSERVVRRLEQAIEAKGPLFTPTTFKKATGKRTAQEMVLLFSDAHASEVVSLEETRGINEYNWPIMLGRLDQVRTGVLSHTQHFGFNIGRLSIFMLGDNLSGEIHEELTQTNDRPATEAVVQFAYDTVAWLKSFEEFFPEIHLAGVVGNHPRASKKPAAKLAHNNADWLYYKMIEALLQGDPRYSFNFPRGGFAEELVCGRYRALLMHGDGIRTSMPGVPWAGISRRVTTLEQQFSKARKPLDYVLLGHWHTRNVLDGIQAQTFMNGSLKGVDEYSLKQFGSGRDPSQTLLTFHPSRGWTGQYALDLGSRLPASEGWLA